MHYRHAPAADHAALDAVLVSAPGRPTLPVRLTVELFARARAHLPGRADGAGGVTVWDPCCGAGATLAVLGLLCPGVAALAGTDADPAPLDLARRNLGLLDPGGPAARAAELDALAVRHGKESYAAAAAAARTVTPASRPGWTVAAADALDPAATRAALGDREPDVVLADLPHGRQTGWAAPARTGTGPAPARPADPGLPGSGGSGSSGGSGGSAGSGGTAPEVAFLTAVAAVLPPHAVVVGVGRGRSVPVPAGVRPLERVRAGHRAAALLRAGDLHP